MPQTGNRINILHGTQQTYDTLQTHDENSIYFCEDSKRIYVGDVEYAPAVDWSQVYPINSIIMFYDNLDHSSHLGLTWERCLQGNVPVGIDSSDSDFNTVGRTLGEKSHTLTSEESVTLSDTSITPGILGSQHDVISGYGNPGQPHNNIQPSEVISFWKRIN